jgi:capsule polysaccharide modification protein KpsS
MIKLVKLIFLGIASLPVMVSMVKKHVVNFVFEDGTVRPSWVTVAKNRVLSEE